MLRNAYINTKNKTSDFLFLSFQTEDLKPPLFSLDMVKFHGQENIRHMGKFQNMEYMVEGSYRLYSSLHV